MITTPFKCITLKTLGMHYQTQEIAISPSLLSIHCVWQQYLIKTIVSFIMFKPVRVMDMAPNL